MLRDIRAAARCGAGLCSADLMRKASPGASAAGGVEVPALPTNRFFSSRAAPVVETPFDQSLSPKPSAHSRQRLPDRLSGNKDWEFAPYGSTWPDEVPPRPQVVVISLCCVRH